LLDIGRARRLRWEAHSVPELSMSVHLRVSGCLASIVISVVLTVLLNLVLRSCA
jgi:hypothetical protein